MKFIEDICNQIVNPPKIRYSPFDLGSALNPQARRHDFQVLNSRGHTLQVSFYEVSRKYSRRGSSACVIYLHSMNGSRLESLSYAQEVTKMGLNFCSFDFSGCGNSEGTGISFGANQQNDIAAVIDALGRRHSMGRFILWGRSMGAASAIKYCENKDNFEIIGLILDSCFKSFEQLAVEIGHRHSQVPQFLMKIGLYFIQTTLEEKGGFKLEQLELEGIAQNIDIPVLLLASTEDTTVDCSHSQALYSRFRHPTKKLVFIKGLHNESRDGHYMQEVMCFIEQAVNSTGLSSRRHSHHSDYFANRFEKILSNQRNFSLQGDEWDTGSTNCYCSIFPTAPSQTDIEEPAVLTTRRRATESNIDREKVRLSKAGRHRLYTKPRQTINIYP